jgi:hypothetical protein
LTVGGVAIYFLTKKPKPTAPIMPSAVLTVKNDVLQSGIPSVDVTEIGD